MSPPPPHTHTAANRTPPTHLPQPQVKTNNVDRYIVKPHITLLRPGESREIAFVILANQTPSFLGDMAAQARRTARF